MDDKNKEKIIKPIMMAPPPDLKRDISNVDASKLAKDITFETWRALDIIKIETGETTSKLKKALATHRYLVKVCQYDLSAMDEKRDDALFYQRDLDEVTLRDLHRGLCQHHGVCTSITFAYIHLLAKQGIEAQVVYIGNDDNNKMKTTHALCVFKDEIGRTLFSDVTLSRQLLELKAIKDINMSNFAFEEDFYFNTFRKGYHITSIVPMTNLDKYFKTNKR